jgi:hypothetical protein
MATGEKTSGFVVTTPNFRFKQEPIKPETLQKIIDALAIEWPKIERHRDITSIYIYNFPDSTPAPKPASESQE